MLIGVQLGTQIAQSLTSPTAPPSARALILAQWIKIGNILCTYIQANAMVNIPTLMVSPTSLVAPGPQILLANGGGPVTGTINVLGLSTIPQIGTIM